MKFNLFYVKRKIIKNVFIYGFVACIFVLLSRKMLNLVIKKTPVGQYLHIIEGWILVCFTIWLLYYLISRIKGKFFQNNPEDQNFYDNVDQGIYQVSPEGNFLKVNLALVRIYGYSNASELMANCSWQKLNVDPKQKKLFAENLSTKGIIVGEKFEVYRRDGSIICTIESAYAVRDKLGNLLYYQGTVQEIDNPGEKISELPAESNSILHAVIEGMTDAVFVKNLQGQYLMTNETGANLLSKSVNEVIGADDWELFRREIAQQIRESDRQVLATGETLTYEETSRIFNLKHRSKDRIVIISKSIFCNAEGKSLGLISIVKDITDYKQVESERRQLLEQIKKDTQDLAALAEITNNAASTLNLEQLLDSLLQQIVEVLAADSAVILLAENSHLSYATGIGIREQVSANYRMPIGEGFAGRIATTMQPLYVEDPIKTPTIETLNAVSLQFILQMGIRTMLGVPLKRNGNCIGVIHLAWCQIHPYSEHEIHLLEITAERCAMTIINTELYEQTQRLQKLRQLQIERRPIGFILTDPDFHFLDWNPAAETIFGFTKKEILGKHIFTIVAEADKTNFGIILLRLSEGDMTAHSINENLTKSGKVIICEWRNTPLQESDGTVFGHLFMVQDISELKKAQEERLRYAFYDALTGLPNRAWFLEHLGNILHPDTKGIKKIPQSPISNFAVLFLNLDRFEIVKSSLGHLIADRLLISTAKQLKACLRPTDKIAYLGRDEFAILLENIPNANFAQEIANRIYQQLSLPFNLDGHEIFCSTSIGIAIGANLWDLPDYQRPEDFLRAADTAMHGARGGRGPVVFEPAMQARALSRLQLDTDLRRAIERQEFLVYYQPIVSLKTGKITGFEALVRWIHPTKGMVSPAEFIPLAEETRLIIPIGYWVLRSACQQLRIWQRQFKRDLMMSVNLSGIQLEQSNVIFKIEEILGEIWVNPNTLKLEITESSIMKNPESVTALLNQIKQMKVLLSIDDFGTGYSSLTYLHRFPVDTLKIDRYFVSRMITDSDNLEIVRLIVNLAHNLGMDVTAEGIESLEELSLLKNLDCECGQGYYFSKPVDSQAATALLSKFFAVQN